MTGQIICMVSKSVQNMGGVMM